MACYTKNNVYNNTCQHHVDSCCWSFLVTWMSFQFLYNLFCLQVPNIDMMILTSTNNPFSTCHTVTCKNTILVVFMPPVSLETLSSMIVPQSQCVVKSRCEDILAVGRELDKRTWNRCKFLIQLKVCLTYTGGLSSSTKVFRHCPLAVSQIRLIYKIMLQYAALSRSSKIWQPSLTLIHHDCKIQSWYRLDWNVRQIRDQNVLVKSSCICLWTNMITCSVSNVSCILAFLYIPNLDTFVKWARNNEIWLWVIIDAENVIGMSLEHFGCFTLKKERN